MPTTTAYETDIVAWSNEQAALLRSLADQSDADKIREKLAAIDLEHIAEEVEDVGKSEQRELMSHTVILLAHLLKWEYQPDRRGASWEKSIKAQRIEIAFNLKETPSLRSRLGNDEWLAVAWAKAVSLAVSETGLDVFPDENPWTIEQIMSDDFYPGNDRQSEWRAK